MKPCIALSMILCAVFVLFSNLHAFNDDYEYNELVEVTVADFTVSDSAAIGRKYDPKMAVDGAGNVVIAWRDERYNDEDDIYAQKFSSSGVPVRKNFKVNDYYNYNYSDRHSIGIDTSGNFAVTWFNDMIFTQLYNSGGVAIGKNIQVTDTSFNSYPRSTATGFDESGNFTVLWTYWAYNTDSIKYDMQRYNSTGTPIGGKINLVTFPHESHYFCCSNAFAFAKNGNFLILFDSTNAGLDIFAQMYTNLGAQMTSIFSVSNDNLGRRQFLPAAAFDNAGNFIIAWVDEREVNYAVYAQRYNSTGAPVGANFRVTDDIGGMAKSFPKVATDKTNNFIIAWLDDRNSNRKTDIYAQRYDSNGSAMGGNFKINNVDTLDDYYKIFDIKLQNGKIYTTWGVYNPVMKTHMIWANILDWNNPITILHEENILSSRTKPCRLSQNYPNPFKNLTNIRYSLTENQKVSLMVYNISGQIVKELINERKPAGQYTVAWDGRNTAGLPVPAGVYIYKIVTDGFKQTKRMIVRK